VVEYGVKHLVKPKAIDKEAPVHPINVLLAYPLCFESLPIYAELLERGFHNHHFLLWNLQITCFRF